MGRGSRELKVEDADGVVCGALHLWLPQSRPLRELQDVCRTLDQRALRLEFAEAEPNSLGAQPAQARGQPPPPFMKVFRVRSQRVLGAVGQIHARQLGSLL